MGTYNYTHFHSEGITRIAKNMSKVIEHLNQGGAEIDTIVSRGASGCSIASAVLVLTPGLWHKYLRKPHEQAHSSIGGGMGEKNIVIVDDMIYTGTTMKLIMDSMEDYCRENRRIVAILLGESPSPLERTDWCGLPVFNCDHSDYKKTIKYQKGEGYGE